MNLLVRGAHDEGVYCVDVGLVQPGVIPDTVSRKQKWICVENESLITFAEVKRLVVYPMLLAQFIGIVHKIRPAFLEAPAPGGFDRYLHLPPTLMDVGRRFGTNGPFGQVLTPLGTRRSETRPGLRHVRGAQR